MDNGVKIDGFYQIDQVMISQLHYVVEWVRLGNLISYSTTVYVVDCGTFGSDGLLPNDLWLRVI
jgi:hypothetical protein